MDIIYLYFIQEIAYLMIKTGVNVDEDSIVQTFTEAFVEKLAGTAKIIANIGGIGDLKQLLRGIKPIRIENTHQLLQESSSSQKYFQQIAKQMMIQTSAKTIEITNQISVLQTIANSGRNLIKQIKSISIKNFFPFLNFSQWQINKAQFSKISQGTKMHLGIKVVLIFIVSGIVYYYIIRKKNQTQQRQIANMQAQQSQGQMYEQQRQKSQICQKQIPRTSIELGIINILQAQKQEFQLQAPQNHIHKDLIKLGQNYQKQQKSQPQQSQLQQSSILQASKSESSQKYMVSSSWSVGGKKSRKKKRYNWSEGLYLASRGSSSSHIREQAKDYTCPLSKQIINVLSTTSCCKIIHYEKQKIQSYIQKNNKCPNCSQILTKANLKIDDIFQKLLKEYKNKLQIYNQRRHLPKIQNIVK